MSQFISLEEAIEMTTTYRSNRDTILKPDYQGATFLPNAETFNRSLFDEVLAQEGCKALRIYYGMDKELKVHAVIVGVNEKNEDMLPAKTAPLAAASEDEEEFHIIDTGDRCPTDCPPESALNP